MYGTFHPLQTAPFGCTPKAIPPHTTDCAERPPLLSPRWAVREWLLWPAGELNGMMESLFFWCHCWLSTAGREVGCQRYYRVINQIILWIWSLIMWGSLLQRHWWCCILECIILIIEPALDSPDIQPSLLRGGANGQSWRRANQGDQGIPRWLTI